MFNSEAFWSVACTVITIWIIVIGAIAIKAAPKGGNPTSGGRRKDWNPSGMSDEEWNDATDPRGDDTLPDDQRF